MFFYWRHVRAAIRMCPELENPGDRILVAAYAGTKFARFLPLRQRIVIWLGRRFMAQHFTKNTVSAAFFCGKCGKVTQHRIDDGRKGPCLECIAKLEEAHNLARDLRSDYQEYEQKNLFQK